MTKDVKIPLILSVLACVLVLPIIVGIFLWDGHLFGQGPGGMPFDIEYHEAGGGGAFTTAGTMDTGIVFELPDGLYGEYYVGEYGSDLQAVMSWDPNEGYGAPGDDSLYIGFHSAADSTLLSEMENALWNIWGSNSKKIVYGTMQMGTSYADVTVNTATYVKDNGTLWRGIYVIDTGNGTILTYSGAVRYTSEEYRDEAIRKIEDVVASTRHEQ